MKKIALITGSATRIGASITKYLNANDWITIIHYNNSKEEALILKDQLKNSHVKKVDLRNNDQTRELIRSINQDLGQIDLLVNNAAIFENDNIDNFSIENFNDHIQVNLLAPLILIQEFQKQYKGNDGNIINMLDYSVERLPDKFLSYNISKSGLWAATKMLSLMLAPNIRINAIGPGPVLPSKKQTEEQFKKACKNTVLKHACNLEEIHNTISYIISSPSLTGQIIMLDSGRHLANYDYY